MGMLDWLKPKEKAMHPLEGHSRGPFFGLGEWGSGFEVEPHGDGWQRNLKIDSAAPWAVPTIYGCVMLIARSISQCYPKHIRDSDGDIKTIKTSAAYRVLRNPNSYQSGTELLLNLISTALFDGEAFCVVTRNDRSEIDSLHLLPRGACSPFIDPDTKTIFYSVGESPLAPGGVEFMAPQRDVLHLKFHTPRHPLIGESPIKAASLAAGINVALAKSQAISDNFLILK